MPPPHISTKRWRDIITHLAVCTRNDWAKIDRNAVSNFVLASQAAEEVVF